MKRGGHHPSARNFRGDVETQFPDPKGRAFGLGFQLGTLDEHRRIGHGGAIYGFATSLDILPGDKLGVAVVATKDVANGVTDRIAEEVLRIALAQREGKPLCPTHGPRFC
jgi:CubicO group peptidase (beta-lactamase class C family)